MKSKVTLATTIVFLLASLTWASSVAGAQNSSSFKLVWSLLTNGSGDRTGIFYAVSDRIDAPATGISTGQGYRIMPNQLGEPDTEYDLLLLYINGDNDLWPYITELVDKAQQGAIGSQVVTLMVLDGPAENDSFLYRLDKGGPVRCRLYLITDLTDIESVCSGQYIVGHNAERFSEDLANQHILSDFLASSILQYVDARRIFVSFIGHGGGWSPNVLAGQPARLWGQPGSFGISGELGGLLWDNHSSTPDQGNTLSTKEFGDALDDVKEKTGREIDLIYLDACLMGMWEVAREVQDSARYLLSSASWSWTTFAYEQHVQSIRHEYTTAEIGQQWIDNEKSILCSNKVCQNNPPFTYSLIDLAHMPQLNADITKLAEAATTALPKDKETIELAMQSTICFDSNQDLMLDEQDTYCDLYSLATQLRDTFADGAIHHAAIDLIETLENRVIVAESHGSGRLPAGYPPVEWQFGEKIKGFAIYAPLNWTAIQAADSNTYGWKLEHYNDIAASNESWDEFLRAYRDDIPIPNGGCAAPCGLPPAHLRVGGVEQLFLPLIR